MFDGEAFGQQMVGIVRGYVSAEMEPLRAANKELSEANEALAARVAELEAREIAPPPQGEKGEPGEQGPQGEPGAVDMDAVRDLIREEVAALPAAEKGEAGEQGPQGDRGQEGEAGKDGIGLANALLDRDGNLVLTMTDGTTKSLGRVVGRDGSDGKDGTPGDTFALDDFDIVPVDERTIKMCFTRGEIMHSFELTIPAVIYRGVWREGETYQRGDVVTWGGSMWHCDKDDCTTKPDGGDYTLSVKRGRDGKDAK